MKKGIAVFLMIVFLTLCGSSLATSQMSSNSELEALYGAYIDSFISKCRSKAERIHSKSLNIRREAALNSLKAAFFTCQRADLIQDMLEGHVGVKTHRIHYYLNKRFFSTLREASINLRPHS